MSSKKPKKPSKEEYIPCLYIPCEAGSDKLVIYFHGNAEDIGFAFEMMYLFGQKTKMHVLCMEYPGYGVYRTSTTCEKKIK